MVAIIANVRLGRIKFLPKRYLFIYLSANTIEYGISSIEGIISSIGFKKPPGAWYFMPWPSGLQLVLSMLLLDMLREERKHVIQASVSVVFLHLFSF